VQDRQTTFDIAKFHAVKTVSIKTNPPSASQSPGRHMWSGHAQNNVDTASVANGAGQ
jgi:hypothetical protein